MKAITIIPLSFWAILALLLFIYYAFGLGGVVILAGMAVLISLAGR